MGTGKVDRDIQLVRECVGGSEQAWKEFYSRFVGLVRSVVRRHMGPNAQEVDDVTQSVFVALIPSQKPLFDTQLAATLAQLSDDPSHPGQSVVRGLDWGQTVATEILAWRANDGINAVLPPYVAGSEDPRDAGCVISGIGIDVASLIGSHRQLFDESIMDRADKPHG